MPNKTKIKFSATGTFSFKVFVKLWFITLRTRRTQVPFNESVIADTNSDFSLKFAKDFEITGRVGDNITVNYKGFEIYNTPFPEKELTKDIHVSWLGNQLTAKLTAKVVD